ncbi:MAG: RDD family protein [Mucilaginibacter sp.]
MAHEYYILENNEQQGPYTFNELTAMDLDIHTRVLSPLADTWEDACDLPEFYPYFESQGIYLPTGDNLASFGWRLLAWVIDYVILSFINNFVLTLLVSAGLTFKLPTVEQMMKAPVTDIMPLKDVFLLIGILNLVMIIYHAACEASPMQGSLGKKLCRMVVVDIDGLRLTFVNAFLRNLGKIVSGTVFGIGFLNILWNEHKQSWHDIFAKTYVVKR